MRFARDRFELYLYVKRAENVKITEVKLHDRRGGRVCSDFDITTTGIE